MIRTQIENNMSLDSVLTFLEERIEGEEAMKEKIVRIKKMIKKTMEGNAKIDLDLEDVDDE